MCKNYNKYSFAYNYYLFKAYSLYSYEKRNLTCHISHLTYV